MALWWQWLSSSRNSSKTERIAWTAFDAAFSVVTSRLSAAALALVLASWACPLGAKPLNVGLAGEAPFVIRNGQLQEGISLDVWKSLASDNDLEYRLIPQSNPEQGLEAVEQGRLDLLIGPISITASRLARPEIDFTQPYFFARAGVLLPMKAPTLFSRFQVLFGWAAISSLLLLLAILVAVGGLIWLAERRQNSSQFPQAVVPGVTNGMWFALVTLTTVGYGDKAPVTRLGKGITSAWMVISLIAVSSITAGLASAFTLFLSGVSDEGIRSAEALKEVRVGVVAGTSGEEIAKRGSMRTVPVASLVEAIALLEQGDVEAVVFDRPAIRYHLKKHPERKVRLAPFTLAEETYGFALPADSPLRTPLDVSVLKMQRASEIELITKRYLF